MHGEDLLGRSALPLLGSSQAGARVLFLAARGEILVNTIPFTAPFDRLTVRGGTLPFPDASFGCVVVDAKAVADGRDLRLAASEVSRVLRLDGDVLLLADRRRMPPDLGALRAYGLRSPAAAWSAALAGHGLRKAEAAGVRLDRDRLVEITWRGEGPATPRRHAAAAGSEVCVFRREPAQTVSAVRAVLAEAAAALGSPREGRLERFLVRKIGKSALIASLGSRRVIVRIPRSGVAQCRAERNFAALQELHAADTLPESMRRLIPRALTRGECRGYAYYVEECAEGRTRDESDAQTSWEPGALAFLLELHARTRRPVEVDRAFFEERFIRPVRVIERVLGPARTPALSRLIETMRTIEGHHLPLVWSHGDFALGNCLYDSSGRLSAVVDWELFSRDSLPLLDLLHCMPVAGEMNSHPRWQRFDAVMGLLEAGAGPTVNSRIEQYAERVGLTPSAIPALLIMYWVDHVARRIDARRGDAAWMRKRVDQPLADLQQRFHATRH